jgi:glyoxylase-like metal-dependent hydrolase (beta-lactamase superfamily II)
LAAFVPDATPAACAEVAPGLMADDGLVDLSLHGTVIESGGRRILVDTCAGDDPVARRVLGLVRGGGSITATQGTVRDAVVAAGWAPEDIDVVVCTHLHFDHVGGNLCDGEPAFPAARYVVAGDEWAFWAANQDDDQYPAVAEAVLPLVEAGLVDLVDGDHGLTDEVRLVSTPGHTPGHVSVLIDSGGERAAITGDLVHHPVELVAPAWTMVADTDAARATASRREFVDRFGDGETLILGTHFGGSSAGRFLAPENQWIDA